MPQAATDEEHQRGEAVEHPGQPLPLRIRIDHDKAQVGDLGRPTVKLDGQHRQRIERDRAAARLLTNHGHDGARQPLAVAREDAIGEVARRQRLAGDDAQLRDQSLKLVLAERPARALDDPRRQAFMGA